MLRLASAGLLLCVIFLSGCATQSGKVVNHFYLGSPVDVDGVKVDAVNRTITSDGTHKISYPWIGLSKIALMGWEFVGLRENSPWFGYRFAYLFDFGLDSGFSRNNFTVGLDYNWSEVIIGIQIEQPYDASPILVGGKLAFVL
jgi:hypothetical protein